MQKFNPKVTIVIPVYNGSKYLGEAIDSALAQTYKNIEIIVVNDGSSDNGATDKVAKSYGDKIVYYNNRVNGGAAVALNTAIEHMKGDYFSWLSHDDLYYPEKINRQIIALSKLENKNTIIMSDLDGINERGEKIYKTDYKKHIEDYPPRSKSLIHPIVYNQTHGCVLLIPRVCFDEVGLFDKSQRVAQDFEFFYRAFKAFPHFLISEVLVTARDTSGRMGRRAKPKASDEYSDLYINILSNLDKDDSKLLAADNLQLLSDMLMFSRSAGYIQLEEYVLGRIIIEFPVYVENFLIEYFSNNIKQSMTFSFFNGLEKKLELIFKQNGQVINEIDKVVAEIFGKYKKKYILKNAASFFNIYEIFLEIDYKYSASIVFKRIINNLKSGDHQKTTRQLIAKSIVGNNDKNISELMHAHSTILKDNRPKVLFSSTHWLTGGMERVMSILFEELKQQFQIILVTPYDGRNSEIEIPEGVIHIKYANSIFYNYYDSAILSISLMLNIDILVGFFNLYEGQLKLYELCGTAKIKTIASNHENYFYPYLHYELQKVALLRMEIYKKIDANIWPLNFNAAVSSLTNGKSYVIQNPNTFKIDKVGAKKSKAIIAVGRFNDYIKRIDRILSVFKLVQDRVPESELILVGECDRNKKNKHFNNKSVNEMISELGLDENNIVFAGKVNNVDEYYKKASVLMLTSESEGFGMVINEAACFGVPAVCNYIPGLEDLIHDGKNGFLVDQNDLSGMAMKIASILTDNDANNKMSVEAAKVAANFESTLIGNKWAYLFEQLLTVEDDALRGKNINSALSFKIEDESQFSRLVFDEFNTISAELINKSSELEKRLRYSKLNKKKIYYENLKKSIKEQGPKTTAIKIARKTYIKSRNIVKKNN